MKTPKKDRNEVIHNCSICIGSSKDFKVKVEAKAKEMGVTVSSLMRMAFNEFCKNH